MNIFVHPRECFTSSVLVGKSTASSVWVSLCKGKSDLYTQHLSVPRRDILCNDSELSYSSDDMYNTENSVFLCQFWKHKLEEYGHLCRNTWNSFAQRHLPKALQENHYCYTRAPADVLHVSEREWVLQNGKFWIKRKLNWMCIYLFVSLRF